MNTLVRAGAKSSVPLWMEIDTTGLEPGVYTGLVMLKAAHPGFADEKIELELKVTEVDFGRITLDTFNYNHIPARCFAGKICGMAFLLSLPSGTSMDIFPEVTVSTRVITIRAAKGLKRLITARFM